MPKAFVMGLVVIALVLSGIQVAFAQTRVALVIGNGAYQHAPTLPNPPNDATDVARTLRKIGFDVTLKINLNRRDMAAAFRDFGAKADGADLAVVFYAGHGLQVAHGNAGENYLVPVDAQLLDVRDVDDEALSLNQASERLEGAKARIVILDACRDNPLASQMRGLGNSRSISRGLARETNMSQGTLLVFSTEPGSVAQDAASGGVNSPFTKALLHYLPTPGLEVRQMLTPRACRSVSRDRPTSDTLERRRSIRRSVPRSPSTRRTTNNCQSELGAG